MARGVRLAVSFRGWVGGYAARPCVPRGHPCRETERKCGRMIGKVKGGEAAEHMRRREVAGGTGEIGVLGVPEPLSRADQWTHRLQYA